MTAIKVSYATDEPDPLDNMTEAEREVEYARQLNDLHRTVREQEQRKYAPDQPREHGRFAEVPGGGGIDTPKTTEELHDTFLRGVATYKRLIEEHGGPPIILPPQAVYDSLNVDVAKPEDVTPEQRAICEKAATDFLEDPANRALFDAYGKPEVVTASRVVGDDKMVGTDPRDGGVQGQWAAGTIFLYGGVAGDPDFAAELQSMAAPRFNVGGAEMPATMMHEYGHQVMGVLNLGDSMLPGAFTDAILYSPDTTQHEATDQVSVYAGYSVSEAFSEFFAAIMRPGFDVEDYHGGAREAMDLILDELESATGRRGR